MERYLAIDNVCAWPNLTRLNDGLILATIFNQPCHGRWQGDVECWASRDGKFWTKAGVPAPHEGRTNRMNVSAGAAANGDMVVLASGWSGRNEIGKDPDTDFSDVLPAWIRRSADGGRTWTHTGELPVSPEGVTIPFGDLQIADNGDLCTPAYSFARDPRHDSAWLYRSSDDGRTFNPEPALIHGGDGNETVAFHLGAGRWIAAVRSVHEGKLRQFCSEDDGRTWAYDQDLSLGSQHPAGLTRLADGRLLLVYGNRCPGASGIDARLSDNDGKRWSAPRRIVSLPQADLGYPSSVQLGDGTIVTAYYASNSESHHRYHMGVVLWQADA